MENHIRPGAGNGLQLAIRLLLITLFVFCASTFSVAQTAISGIPKSAVVVETKKLPGHPQRMLALWMLNPKKNPTGYAAGDVYTCPDYSRGSHYSGPTRVALIDTAAMKVINSVKVASFDEEQDSFDVPYAIRKGNYYPVNARTANGVEAKPTVMLLKDYNGDGKPLEFALFEAEACMGLATTLIGYSEKQDRVIQYPVKLTVLEGSKHSERVSPWADYLFNKKPVRPGYWKYEIDYRGRAGSLDKWEVRYNAAREQFEGTLTVIAGD